MESDEERKKKEARAKRKRKALAIPTMNRMLKSPPINKAGGGN